MATTPKLKVTKAYGATTAPKITPGLLGTRTVTTTGTPAQTPVQKAATQATQAGTAALGAAPPGTGLDPGIKGVYDSTVQGIDSGLQTTTAGISAGEDRAASDYGYSITYDPNVGPNGERKVTALTVDPSNPFSRAALLQQSYDNAKRGSTNSYASSGQLYAGSLQNAQNTNTQNFQQGDNTLRSALQDFILGKEGERTTAVDTASGARTAALGTAISTQLGIAPSPTDAGATTGATVASTPGASATPKPGYSHVQTTGTRVGQSYNIKTINGRATKVYANGDRVLV